MTRHYSYRAAISASEVNRWDVQDVLTYGGRPDFAGRALPERLCGVRELAFLGTEERQIVSQIRAHGYLFCLRLIAEVILPFVLDHARQHLAGNVFQVRALLGYANEEARHAQLFSELRAALTQHLGFEPRHVGGELHLPQVVLSRHPLSVALVVLHLEAMSATHEDAAVQDAGVTPVFEKLLRLHGRTGAAHAELVALLVEELAALCSKAEINEALSEYEAVLERIIAGLTEQVRLDLASFEEATGRVLRPAERAEFIRVQERVLRRTFLAQPGLPPLLSAALERLQPGFELRIRSLTSTFN
jgi:hypothetical protein